LVEACSSWNSPGQSVDPDVLDTETATCEALAAAAGPDFDSSTLRALLRRKDARDDPSTALRNCSAYR
jgi:hypothetical protein